MKEMKQCDKIIEGLLILRKYNGEHFIQAAHDQIFGGSSDVPADDDAKLRSMGWTRTNVGRGLWFIYT